MRHILIGLLFSLLGNGLSAVELEEGVWEVLDGCQLISSPINDGDSFLVKYGDERFVFRLYYVDAPETSETYIGRVRDQARYFSIPLEDVTATGELAKKYTRNFLRDEFTVITKWRDARGSGRNKRYFALIRKGEQYLSTELMRAGLARLYGAPTEERWPGGVTPRTFLGRLKNNERAAQREEEGIWALASGSAQLEGLEALSANTEGESLQEPTAIGRLDTKDRINVNTASRETLETLPGIGPALANSMIGARPIETIDSLVRIPGISANKLAAFSHMVMTEDPPPPPYTMDFYNADLEQYLGQVITVHIKTVAASAADSPSSFRAVTLQTAYQGEAGGSIIAYIPDEFYDSFLNYYREPGREFTGLLYDQDGNTVLVYQRK